MRCKSTNQKGKPCGAPALRGEEFCLFHSQSDRAKEIRAKIRHPKSITKQMLLRALARDFDAIKNDQSKEAREERQRLSSLILRVMNEIAQFQKIKKAAIEMGLIDE